VEGLEFLGSFTYGKALSDNIGYYGVGWGQTAVQGFYYLDSTNPLRDYGPSPYDVRRTFSFSTNWQLPIGRGRKIGKDWNRGADAALGGWALHSIFQARSGLALSVTDSAGQSLQATRSNERPDRICTGKNNNASGPDDIWLDINCFTHAAAGQFGNSGAGILHGPGFWNWDLGVAKDFRFDDNRFFTFKIEAFNVLNHPNFAIQQGAVDIADPTSFGKILNTFSAPRIVELVLKFTF